MVWITASWGICFVLIQYGLAYAPVLWFASSRAVFAGVALWGWARVTGRPSLPGPTKHLRLWAGVAAFGLFNATLAFGFMFAGVAGSSAGVAAVLANTQPLLILLPAHWLFGEAAGFRAALGLLVGFAGVIVLTGPTGGSAGVWLSILAAASITTGTLVARQLRGNDVVEVVAWNFLIGGGLLAVVAGVVEGVPTVVWTPAFVADLAFLSVVGTAAAFVAWVQEVHRVPLAVLSSWTFLVPVFGLSFGVILGGDRPGAWTVAGLVLILVSVWATNRFSRAQG